jgi:DNA-binding winged helix-turn-helix (wHTH) protein
MVMLSQACFVLLIVHEHELATLRKFVSVRDRFMRRPRLCRSNLRGQDMQTFPLQNRQQRGMRTPVHGACCITNSESDIASAPQCDTVRMLLQELLSLRAARRATAWQLERMSRALVFGERRVTLTRTQVSVLRVLSDANGAFVPVHDLLMAVWGFAQPIGGGELVRTHIRAIRKRLRECGITDDFINGSRGRGYRINPAFSGKPAPWPPELPSADRP